jgi:hypothetical protein
MNRIDLRLELRERGIAREVLAGFHRDLVLGAAAAEGVWVEQRDGGVPSETLCTRT